MIMSYTSFLDELTKIAVGGRLAGLAARALEAASKHPGKAVAGAAAAGALGAGQFKKMKKRYDIGKQIEEQQRAAQRRG